MRIIVIALAVILSIFTTSFKILFGQINPTGTYILKGTIKKNVIEGYNGEIRAKLLSENKVALSFYIDKGSPGFEAASFSDTFFYFDNRASYHSLKDPDCTINFVFNATSVETFFVHSTPQCSCGFERGVIIPATFSKTSAESPVIKNILRGTLQ